MKGIECQHFQTITKIPQVEIKKVCLIQLPLQESQGFVIQSIEKVQNDNDNVTPLSKR